jgi:demethylmenaquinone methyltransferase/2-methoxy-6-polyprenyl-1,4-benzoquinol methylase
VPSFELAKGELPVGEEKTRVVRSMFDAIAPRYEFVNKIITFGLDRRWRRATLASLGLERGSLVLDVACGTGDFTKMANASGFVSIGVDLSLGMLEAASSPITAVEADGAFLPFATGTFDGVLCGYALRNFTDLDGVIAEMARVLRPGGRLAIIDVAAPNSRLLKFGYNLWFNRCVPFLGGLLSNKAAYSYLPRSTAYLPPRDELLERFRRAGFSGVNHHLVFGGLSQRFQATKHGR